MNESFDVVRVEGKPVWIKARGAEFCLCTDGSWFRCDAQQSVTDVSISDDDNSLMFTLDGGRVISWFSNGSSLVGGRVIDWASEPRLDSND